MPNLNGGLLSALFCTFCVTNAYAIRAPTENGCVVGPSCHRILTDSGNIATGWLGAQYYNVTPEDSISGCGDITTWYSDETCVTFNGNRYAYDCKRCLAGYELVETRYTFDTCDMLLNVCVKEGCSITDGPCSGDTGATIDDCVDVRTKCIAGNQTVTTCNACAEGARLVVDQTITIDGCDNIQSYRTHKCSKSITVIDPCENCFSDTSWSLDATNNVYKKVDRECVKQNPDWPVSLMTCKETTHWSCMNGSWGALSDNGDGSGFTGSCSSCGSLYDVYAASVVGSNSAVTGCYIPAERQMNDGTGNFVFTSDCYNNGN